MQTVARLTGVNSKKRRLPYAPTVFSRRWKKLHHSNAFTLVELMVVIIIIGTLVAVAVPLYLHYSETAKVREALGMMQAIMTSQKLEKIRTLKYYSATGDAASVIFSEKGIDVGDSVYFTYETTGNADKFTITATAESDMTGTITYDSATKTWSCTGDIIEKMLPQESK
jgi:prepilin-type N-terminal cleavage/methylation domain-containing protein